METCLLENDNTRLSYLEETLFFREQEFKRACDQITILNREITYLHKRYTQVNAHNQRSFRYNFRLRIATLEGVRCVFYKYAEHRASMLDQINQQLYTLQSQEKQHNVTI